MLTDNFKRKIDYLRISVTDRCDLRCTYCMAEDVTFLPRQEVLSIEEIINFYMGKNTQERQEFIIDKLRVEKDLIDIEE